MNEIFTLKHQNHYNLRNRTDFGVPNAKIVNNGSEGVTYHVPKIWEIIPTHIDKIDKFKIAIKNRKRIWPCRLCKVYLQNVGYIHIYIYIYIYVYIYIYI